MEVPGLVEVHEEGLVLTSPDTGTVGITWDALNTLFAHPVVARKLEELENE